MSKLTTLKKLGYDVSNAFDDIFDDAIIGVETTRQHRIIYDYNKMVSILLTNQWSDKEAYRFIDNEVAKNEDLIIVVAPITVFEVDG